MLSTVVQRFFGCEARTNDRLSWLVVDNDIICVTGRRGQAIHVTSCFSNDQDVGGVKGGESKGSEQLAKTVNV